MTTLTELNGKVWYRFLKVIYILLYLTFFLSLLIVYKSSEEYHDKLILPDTIEETLKDPEFYKLDYDEMRNVLSSIDEMIFLNVFDQFDTPKKEKNLFKNFTDIEQEWYVSGIKKQPVPTTPLKKKYIYKPYHKLNIMNFVKYSFIVLICYILVMECIRRGFYYIVIGKLFPKE